MQFGESGKDGLNKRKPSTYCRRVEGERSMLRRSWASASPNR